MRTYYDKQITYLPSIKQGKLGLVMSNMKKYCIYLPVGFIG